MTCTSRQINFEILRDNYTKIGMNTTANKFYCLSRKIGLNSQNTPLFTSKKMMKIQFLKNGKT